MIIEHYALYMNHHFEQDTLTLFKCCILLFSLLSSPLHGIQSFFLESCGYFFNSMITMKQIDNSVLVKK